MRPIVRLDSHCSATPAFLRPLKRCVSVCSQNAGLSENRIPLKSAMEKSGLSFSSAAFSVATFGPAAWCAYPARR